MANGSRTLAIPYGGGGAHRDWRHGRHLAMLFVLSRGYVAASPPETHQDGDGQPARERTQVTTMRRLLIRKVPTEQRSWDWRYLSGQSRTLIDGIDEWKLSPRKQYMVGII